MAQGEFVVTGVIKGSATDPVSIHPHPDVLSSITNTGTTLAIWRRELSDALTVIANTISQRAVDIVTTLDPFCNEARPEFKRALSDLEEDQIELLVEDVVYLSQSIANACQKKLVRIRLESVADDGCRRFHLDNVFMRLIVTYAGAGTQWVPPAFAAAARDQQEDYNGPIHSIGTGDAAIFRGKKSGEADLIFHRSPPLKGGDSPRLVVVIDGVDP